MKKLAISLAILGVFVLAFGNTGTVFAQTSTPQAPGTTFGYLHEEMVAIYAEALGLSVDDLNARLESGETLGQIAYSTGMTVTEFRDLAGTLREDVLNLAVQNGTITQEQADWMLQNGNGQNAGAGNGNGYGAGAGTGTGAGVGMGGGRGAGAGQGQGRNANPTCPLCSASSN